MDILPSLMDTETGFSRTIGLGLLWSDMIGRLHDYGFKLKMRIDQLDADCGKWIKDLRYTTDYYGVGVFKSSVHMLLLEVITPR